MAQSAASQFYARKRMRSMRSVVSSLFKTHKYLVGATSIDTGDAFGDATERTRPVTVQFTLERSDNTISGTLFQFGSAARRFSATLAGANLLTAAGTSGADKVTVVTLDAYPNRVLTTGTAQAGSIASTIILAAGESAEDDIFVGDLAVTTGGTGGGQTRTITAYDGTTKVATVSPNWAVTPDDTTTYSIQRTLQFDFSICADPATGRVTIWRDGVLLDSDVTVNGDFDGAWCDDDATGLVGGSLVGVDMSPLSVFHKQLPQRRRAG